MEQETPLNSIATKEWVRKEFVIARKKGNGHNATTADGWVCGHFGVHKEGASQWSVTELSTGFSAVKLGTRKLAKSCAEELNSLPWPEYRFVTSDEHIWLKELDELKTLASEIVWRYKEQEDE